jgi:hypothetical protein
MLPRHIASSALRAVKNEPAARWVVRALKTEETGIAVDAAKRTDSDCAEKILLHSAVAMRPKYLRAATMWTESFGVSLHFHYAFPANKAA